MQEEVYPLVFPERPRSRTFYYALGLVIPVAVVTPGCFAFTFYYVISTALHPTRSIALHPAKLIFLIYSLVEIVFFLHLQYLGWRIQEPNKAVEVDPDECLALFHRMMQSGLGEVGERETGSHANVGAWTEDGGSVSTEKAVMQSHDSVHEVSGYNLRPSSNGRPPSPSPSIRSPTPRRISSLANVQPSAHVESSPNRSSGETVNLANPSPSTLAAVASATLPSPRTSTSGRSLNVPHQAVPPSRSSSPDVTIERLSKDDPRAIEFRERLRNWFDRVPFSSLTRADLLTWLCFACFNLPYESIGKEADESKRSQMIALLEKSAGLLEKRIGIRFDARGRQISEEQDEDVSLNDRVMEAKRSTTRAETTMAAKVMRVTMDPVNCMTRPLLIYAFAGLINWWLKAIVYRNLGVRVYKQGDMEYLLRIPKDWKKGMGEEDRAPIVYIHGLGFGLLQNHFVIHSLLTRLQTHPILVPLQPNISMDFFSRRHRHPLTRHETVESIVQACERWGFWVRDADDEKAREETGAGDEKRGSVGEEQDPHTGGVVVMSHSNGSVTHTWILKDHPNFVRRSAFVDPVTFCLWEGSLCYNFCYRRPRTGMELLIFYYIASEIGIANTIQRHFDWASNSLFCEQIPEAGNPEKNAFFLGGKDVIVDANRVYKYLTRHNIVEGLHMDPEAGHGEGLAGVALDRLIHWLATGKLDPQEFGEPSSSFVISVPDSPGSPAGVRSEAGTHEKDSQMSRVHSRSESSPRDSRLDTSSTAHSQAEPLTPADHDHPSGGVLADAIPPPNSAAKLDPSQALEAGTVSGATEGSAVPSTNPSSSTWLPGRRPNFIAERERRPGKVNLVLISTGSVASIKIPLIWQALIEDGRFLVQIVATTPSLQFYDAAEIRADQPGPCDTNVWTDEDDVGSWEQKGDPILHIELRRWADLVFVAPCTANTIAKIAGGICDNLATSFLRALTPETPTYIFPAMNTFMYQHPLTAKHLGVIEGEIGYHVVGPIGRKELACGDVGPGAMTEWKEIVQLARDLAPGILAKSGPAQE